MTESPQVSSKLHYRPDVDGLRAVAVLLVVLDHIGTRITGGYVGVDVFFVISGYLISSVIISEMTAGIFSISNFYERRVRRILPALFVMILCVSILVYRFCVPSEVESFARSSLAAEFSVSNFLFLKGTGYFDAPSAFKPLLHTWSLSVEEQFYILFPIFLVCVKRWCPHRLRSAIWTVAAVSFALACVWVRRDPMAAFYLAPLRAWELLFGTIISQHYLPAIKGRLSRNLASFFGLMLILVPSILYSADTRFPGLTALPPCLGAALIIASGETGPSVVGSVLKWRPFVFIGLISYSLYLWHWPILVFQSTSFLLVDSPRGTKRAKLAVFVVSIVVGALSWRFVETPFRKGRFRPTRLRLFTMSAAAFAVVSAIGVYMIATNGISSRFAGEALDVSRYASFSPADAYRENVCFLEPESNFSMFRPDVCLKEDHAKKQYLLLGDSHGAQLYVGLANVFLDVNISQATVAQCRPFLNEPAKAKPNCFQMSDYIYKNYLPHHHVDAVLLAGRWEEREIPELERTVRWIEQNGMKVIIFGPNIEFDLSLPRILAISLRDQDPSAIMRHRTTEPQALDRQLAMISRDKWGARYISIYEDLCSSSDRAGSKVDAHLDSSCPVMVEAGVPILFDSDHLTPRGSLLYANAMKQRGQLP